MEEWIEMKKKKALVTGCAGFIGSHLTERLLDEGFEIIGIDCFTDYYEKDIKEKNLEFSLKNKNFKFIEKDLFYMDEYPEVDYVFHHAAQAGVRASWGKEFEVYTKYNIQLTQKLLEFYKDLKIKKFVYASSSSVYGDAEALPMREDNLLKPFSPYGVTKLAGENLCFLYYRNYEIPTISLRYFTVFGPRQRPDMGIYKFVKSFLDGSEIKVFGDGNQTRDFTYISDVVEANVLAANTSIRGEIFNIGGGNRITVNELIKIISQITGKDTKILYIDDQKGDVKDTWADIDKAKSLLKWSPSINISDGLQEFIKWMSLTKCNELATHQYYVSSAKQLSFISD
jgi:nucleoside-diphosphate-sugar epimerase